MHLTPTTDLDWQAPGPGRWIGVTDHWTRPVTPIIESVLLSTFSAGFEQTLGEFGSILRTLDLQMVNGIPYVRPVAIVDKPGDATPPRWVVRAVTRLHPEFRRRERLSRHSFANKSWMIRLERWRETQQAHYLEANRGLQAAELEPLTDAELIDHLDSVIANLRAGYRTHFELAPITALPLGLLLVEAEQRWSIDPVELLEVLQGASNATTAPLVELQRLRDELHRLGCVPTKLDDVRDASPKAGRLLEEWLADKRWIVSTGYDLDALTLEEMPGVVLSAIKATTPRLPHSDPAVAFRNQVPADDNQLLTDLVNDAREAFAVRDENGPLTGEWPAGLVRRALLEAGQRLVHKGLLERADLAVEASRNEIQGLLLGVGQVDGSALAERHQWRHAVGEVDIPSVLGEEAEPDIEALPESLARGARCATAVLDLEFAQERRLMELSKLAKDDTLAGTGIGTHLTRGRARVARSPDDLINGVEPGDIVVTPATAPTWNIILAAAEGLVVEEGGLTGHAAIVAREFNLPTIIGVKNATTRIPDLAEIELDTVTGEIHLL